MATTIAGPRHHQSPSRTEGREPKYRTPPGHRVIHAVVPEAIFVHVHKMALESGMRFTHYLVRFLEDAWPYSTHQPTTESNHSPCVTPGIPGNLPSGPDS